MKRKIYNKLKDWKDNRARKEALLIDGARRVGKSYIVEEFAKNEYTSYILVNFANITKELREIFDNYLNDLDSFFTRLSLWSGVKLYKHETLIIFDEVQLYPKAREAIKWFVADNRYDYIETGSLVSIRKNTKGIIVPSEECHLDMHSMDFEEFLWALGEDSLMPFVEDCFVKKQAVGAALHRKLMDYLRLYMIVGGMPQAVNEYVESRDFNNVDHIKRNILNLYRNDIYNYASNDASKVVRIFDSVPGQLQRHEKRFRIGDLQKGARTRDYQNAFFWLDESRIINTCYAATEPSIGLKLNRDDARYKLYFADTGLLISHSFDENEILSEKLYAKLLLDKIEINKGMLVENLVSQMFKASGKRLYYYAQSNRDNSEENMEIDFLIRKPVVTTRHNICPVEVKSSNNYKTSSLIKFRNKFNQYLDICYVLHSGDLKEDNGILYLPLYMTPLL